MKFKGVCMHHDQGSLGSAAEKRAIERQVQILKEMGANAIRVTHNPADPYLLEVCSREGIMVINELLTAGSVPRTATTTTMRASLNRRSTPTTKF